MSSLTRKGCGLASALHGQSGQAALAGNHEMMFVLLAAAVLGWYDLCDLAALAVLLSSLPLVTSPLTRGGKESADATLQRGRRSRRDRHSPDPADQAAGKRPWKSRIRTASGWIVMRAQL